MSLSRRRAANQLHRRRGIAPAGHRDVLALQIGGDDGEVLQLEAQPFVEAIDLVVMLLARRRDRGGDNAVVADAHRWVVGGLGIPEEQRIDRVAIRAARRGNESPVHDVEGLLVGESGQRREVHRFSEAYRARGGPDIIFA